MFAGFLLQGGEKSTRGGTCAVAHALVLDDVLVLQRLEDLDLSLKVSYVLRRAVLELLHRHHLAGVVLQRVIAAHLHAAKVSLEEEKPA